MVRSLEALCVQAIRRNLSGRNAEKLQQVDILKIIPNSIALRILFGSHDSTSTTITRWRFEILQLFADIEIDELDFNRFFHCEAVNMDKIIQSIITQTFKQIDSIVLRNIEGSKFTDYGFVHLCVQYGDSLRHINVSGCQGITYHSLQMLSNLCLSIESLAIEECRVDLRKEWPITSSTLNSLHMGGNIYDESILYEIATKCPNITVLSILHSISLSMMTKTTTAATTTSAVSDTVYYHPFTLALFPNMKRLDLRRIQFQYDCIVESLLPLQQLETLDASYTNFNDVFVQGLVTQPKLQALSLCSTCISICALELISNSMSTSILQLSLSSTNLSLSSSRGSQSILWSFQRLVNLKELDLSSSNIMLTSAHVQYFQQMTDNKFKLFPENLDYLDISGCTSLLHNTITSTSDIITDSLQCLGKLRSLHMNGLKFSTLEFALILTNKQSLTSLDLCETNIRDEIYESHITQLKELRYLGLKDSAITLDCIQSRSRVFPRLQALVFWSSYDSKYIIDEDILRQLSGGSSSRLHHDYLNNDNNKDDNDFAATRQFIQDIVLQSSLSLPYVSKSQMLEYRNVGKYQILSQLISPDMVVTDIPPVYYCQQQPHDYNSNIAGDSKYGYHVHI